MSEDDSSSERCPICQEKECRHHLLACFDKSGDEGKFAVGLIDGALNEAHEIQQVLKRARLAWVQSVRSAGKPKAPLWIMKDEWGLRCYFDALGGIDVDKYDSDEDAVHDLAACTDSEVWHAREEFLWEDLGRFSARTEKEIYYGGFPAATTYLYWWAPNPREIVKEFRVRLQSMLLEANTGQ
jgi:hypothetical protein